MTSSLGEEPDLPDTLEACHRLIMQLGNAMKTRVVIEQAKGMLIAQHRCSPEEAFEMLREASRRDNRNLHVLATAMVAGA